MSRTGIRHRILRAAAGAVLAGACATAVHAAGGAASTPASPSASNPAGQSGAEAALAQRLQSVGPSLQRLPAQRRWQLESFDEGNELSATLDALVDQPFAAVAATLQSPAHWCGILMLHLYTRECRVTGAPGIAALAIAMSRTADEPLAKADRLRFGFSADAAAPAYVEVRMAADAGPYGTRDYRILLRAMPVDDGSRTFMQLRYGYAYGMAARMALQAYLGTFGRHKVGFTPTGRDERGEPIPIGGTRGLIERNTVRYHLGIETYLATLGVPPAQRLERRLADWFDANERHARQLHEVDRASYLAAKRAEHQRLGESAAP
ncbi:MAG: hypothetical protein EOO24_02795 [Comamonadaceae bacterium]|nr:MAG: hypothetical protein EOO24_02795 [Comamonadaceae bacterium]